MTGDESGRAPQSRASGGIAPRRLLPLALALGLVLLGLAFYLPLLPRSAVLEDGEVALQHPAVTHGSGLSRTPFYSAFHRPLWRPLTTASYRADRLWARPRPAEAGGAADAEATARAAAMDMRRAMGRTNVAIALGAVLLAMLLFWRLGAGRWAGALLAALLLLHPAGVDSILSLAGRADLLSACGVLGALLLYMRWIRPPAGAGGKIGERPGAGIWLAWGGLFVLALLAKESALLLPVFLVGYELTLGPAARGIEAPGRDGAGDRGARVRAWATTPGWAAVIALALVILWLGARWAVMQGWPGAFVRDPAEDFVQGLSGGERLRLALFLPLHYAGLLLLMVPALPGYGYLLARHADAPPVTLGDPSTFGVMAPSALQAGLGLAALAGAVLVFLVWRRRAPLAAFGLWLCVAGIVAALPLLRPNGQVASTRVLFFPLLGLLLVLLHAGREWIERIARRDAARRPALAVAGLLLLAALAVGAGLRARAVARPWETQESLLTAFAGRAPLAPEVPLARSRDAIARRDLAAAAGHLEEAVGLFPRAPRTLLTLGLIRAQQGNQSLAARLFSDAAVVADRVMPHSSVAVRAHLSIGTLLARQKLEDLALEEFRKALHADSTDVEALARAGLLESIRSRTAREGIRHLRRALELDREQPTLGAAATERLQLVLDRAVRYMESPQRGDESYDEAMGSLDSLLTAPRSDEEE